MFFNGHNHTATGSNIRLIDCIIKPLDLIDRAIQLGLSGVAITDHECLSAHMEVNMYAKKLRETNPDFTIALGNEIYLTETREKNQKYFHFILIAKDAYGYEALRKLSSTAWYNIYWDRGLERVPTLKSELADVMRDYKGHIIATTACIGGELPKLLQARAAALKAGMDVALFNKKIDEFINYCINVFGKDDFYIECAPSTNEEQMAVNVMLYNIAQNYGLKMTVATDSHYLSKETRFAHKAYLNSKNGEREVDAFYEFARLMDEEEVRNLLYHSFPVDVVDVILKTTEEIRKKITFYSLERNQKVVEVNVPDYPACAWWGVNNDDADEMSKYPVLCGLFTSDNIQERYWVNECWLALKDKGLEDNDVYIARLETEADVIKYIGNQLGTCLFAYFNTFKHYIDLFWECGSIVGPGRGSATGFLSNYLLGITQLDPIRWNLVWWRFLNKERAELPDIDIDLAPSKRPLIFKKIREERGELGLIQVATFGTEGTKSAILTACRGYRHTGEDGKEEFPDGIDVDEAQYISSLIPSERGFLWSINDVINGNPEKGRMPITTFKHKMDEYPGLLDIILNIEGIVNKRSSHASGVIFYDKGHLTDTSSIMRTPSGDLITCFDLHKAEACGDTKYDFLVTEISDKIIQCLNLLQEDDLIEKDLSLRQLYNKYLHPENIDVTNPKIWEALGNGSVLDVFQFSTGVGLAIAKRIKPENPIEMTAANAMMRLMSEKGKESQQDRFLRIKKMGIETFSEEMKANGIPDNVQKALHKYCDEYYGCVPIQEQMMSILMDKDIAAFSLKDANDARKIVAKKQMNRIPELREKFNKTMDSHIGDYVWNLAVAPSLGYAFSLNHSLPYSFVGIQCIVLATQFNPIYWNTACLIVNSGATDENIEGTTNYGKIAKAIGDIRSRGIKVSLANINKSMFGFIPDKEENEILFGLKGMLNVGDDLISTIIENRPYNGVADFVNKIHPNKQPMISLIKGGAFDEFEDRKKIFATYIWITCDKKSKLNLTNVPSLIKYHLLDNPEIQRQRSLYEFNRYLKDICVFGSDYYKLDTRALAFITRTTDMRIINHCGAYIISKKEWTAYYDNKMDVLRDYLRENQKELLYQLNKKIFYEDYLKYGGNQTISAWEMESLCFYYHEHELAQINEVDYGLNDFYNLPEEPVVDKFWKKNGHQIPIYKLNRVYGTCIAKDNVKNTVTLLSPKGVFTVKFRKEYFALFDRQISAVGDDGKKHVIEKGWFNRGNMLIITGIRRGDDFIPKKYASTSGHQLYKIININNECHTIEISGERAKGEVESDG